MIMKTYRIICKTDGYHAARNAKFNGKCWYNVLASLSLRDAQIRLLDMYNEMYMDERPYCYNWGQAVNQSKPYIRGAYYEFLDGLRMFDYDVYTIVIEEENKDF